MFQTEIIERIYSENVQIFDILSILCSKPLLENRKPRVKKRDRIRTRKYHLTFGKGYRPQPTAEVFESYGIASRKVAIYTMKNQRVVIIRGEFHQEELLKVCNNGVVYKKVSFSISSPQLSPEKTFSSFRYFLLEHK